MYTTLNWTSLPDLYKLEYTTHYNVVPHEIVKIDTQIKKHEIVDTYDRVMRDLRYMSSRKRPDGTVMYYVTDIKIGKVIR